MPPSRSVISDLDRFGPSRQQVPCSLAEALAYCRELTHTHYENFTVASWLLPRPLVPHFHAVYSWCRWADDLADETGDATQSSAHLNWWRDQLLECYAGRAVHPVLVALHETICEFAIPEQPFLDLLSAFQRDQIQTRYDTWSDLLDYCRCSANPVGQIVLRLGRCYNERNASLSDSICTGLQLINFWQDVAIDYSRKRVYLPRESWSIFAFSETDLAAATATPAARRLLEFSVQRAEEFLSAGKPLAHLVSPEIRLEVELFLQGGLSLVSAIRRQDYDVWSRRPSVGKLTKLQLLLAAIWKHRFHRRGPRMEPSRERPGIPHG